MILRRRQDENFIQRHIRRRKRRVMLRALKGDRKSIRRVWREIDPSVEGIIRNAGNKVSNAVDKTTAKSRITALEGAVRSIQKVERTKRIFIQAHDKLRGGKKVRVEGFWKRVSDQLDLTTKVEGASFLDRLTPTASSVTASANATRVVRDGMGGRYVMKASSTYKVKEPLARRLGLGYERNFNLAITEALLSDVAKDVGVRAQETILIPKGTIHSLTNKNQVYTLHRFLPGKSLVSAVNSKELDKRFNLSFKFNPKEDRRTGKYHSSREKLMMALEHKDLSKILAFGSTFSNYDMHGDNIWYHRGRFSLIDQGESLNFPMDFSGIKGAIASDYDSLTPKQRRNLGAFNSTLKTIGKRHPPERVEAKLDAYFEKAAGKSTSSYERSAAKMNIERKKAIYRYNYQESQKLSKWIDTRENRTS